jgi:hypothetical protein
MSKPEGPDVILANIVVVLHFGHGGREIGNMMLRLGLGGSAILSVAGSCHQGPAMAPAWRNATPNIRSILLMHGNLLSISSHRSFLRLQPYLDQAADGFRTGQIWRVLFDPGIKFGDAGG